MATDNITLLPADICAGKNVESFDNEKFISVIENIRIEYDFDEYKPAGERVKFIVHYEGSEFLPTRIKDGGYGSIYLVNIDSYEFIIKKELSSYDKLDEIRLLKEKTEAFECGDTILICSNLKGLDEKIRDDMVAMPYATGDLSELEGKLTEDQINKIIKLIGRTLLCLFEKNIYYFDIKSENILFKCIGTNEIQIFLGDLGSIMPLERSSIEKYISTYPLILYDSKLLHPTIDLKDDFLYLYTYLLIILTIELMGTTTNRLCSDDNIFSVWYDLLQKKMLPSIFGIDKMILNYFNLLNGKNNFEEKIAREEEIKRTGGKIYRPFTWRTYIGEYYGKYEMITEIFKNIFIPLNLFITKPITGKIKKRKSNRKKNKSGSKR